MINQFLLDLERGKKEEKKVYHYFLRKYPKTVIYNGYKKEYDILVNGVCGIEVKFDERSKNTGNFFIESYFNNKKSGINSTLAKLWVISNGEKYFFINTKQIKNFIKEKNLKLLKTILQGIEVKFYLLSIIEIEQYGKYIQLD
jgi:hypothetical protein